MNTEIPSQNTVEVAKKRRLIMTCSVLGASALLAVGVNSKPAEAKQEAQLSNPEMVLGAMEDSIVSTDLTHSKEIANKLAEAGFNTIKITVPWTYPKQCAEMGNDTLRFRNAVQATKDAGLNLAINMIPNDKKGRVGQAPVTTTQMRCYIDTAGAFMSNFAFVNPGGKLSLELTNEPNSETFWRPQTNGKKEWTAPSSVAKLYSKAYNQLHDMANELGIDLTIIGPGLASNHDALKFIDKMAPAEQKNKSSEQLFDVFSIHPYGINAEEHPTHEHPEKAVIGLGDYPELKKKVSEVFGANMPISYTEYGVIASVPSNKHYVYRQLSSSVKSVKEAKQAEFYKKAIEMSYCQKAGGFILFNVIDDPTGHWTSGIFYPDGSPKSSYSIVKQAIADAKSGNIIC